MFLHLFTINKEGFQNLQLTVSVDLFLILRKITWITMRLLKAKEKEYDHLTVLGGIHSLRAASESDIKTIFSATTGDFHIHIAEQLKEVNDCVAHTGMRPVEYLLDKLDNHQRLQLVHATHLCEKEIELVASSGANVVICPTTESNLGDGTFPLQVSFKKWHCYHRLRFM